MLSVCALALLALPSLVSGGGEVTVGDRPAFTFTAEPFGLPGLERLEDLRGAATLLLFADPAQAKSFPKIAAEASALRKRYGRDLAVILVAPPGEGTWRAAHEQRCFAGGVALSTEVVLKAPEERPFAVVLDAFGEVLHAEKAALDLDRAKQAVEIAVTGVKSAEAYAPSEIAAIWRSMEKGLVQQGFDALAKLNSSSDPVVQQAAATALEWWKPRLTCPLERAERLLAEERWSEANDLLDELFGRLPGLAKAQDPFAERARAARAQRPTEKVARAADEALHALTQELVRKGPTKALREKLARLASDPAEERVAARARALLARL